MAILLTGVVLLAGMSVAAPSASAATAATAHAKHQRGGPYAVGLRSYTFVDRSRPTAPNNSYPGAPTRTLPTVLLYPAKGDPAGAAVENAAPLRRRHGFPLIVFSHGFTATGPAYRFVLDKIARQGYVVAAPTFRSPRPARPAGPSSPTT